MPSELPFLAIAAFTLVSAIAAMSLRNLVHCGLCVAGAFAGIAALYLQLNAEFVGFAQILVYVGAVAILIVFTILLTRGTEITGSVSKTAVWTFSGIFIAALVFGAIGLSILNSHQINRVPEQLADATVKRIGERLMTTYVLPLEVIALLLTAALIGAVIIAMREKVEPEAQQNPGGENISRPTTPPWVKSSALEVKS